MVQSVIIALTVRFTPTEVERLRLIASEDEKYAQLHPNSYFKHLLENNEYTKALEISKADDFQARLRDTIVPAYFICGSEIFNSKLDIILQHLNRMDHPLDATIHDYLNQRLTHKQVNRLPDINSHQKEFKKYMMMSLI